MDEPENVVYTSLDLRYQQEILNSIRKDNALVVLAKGLGLLSIVANFLHICDELGNMVVLVGADPREESLLGEALAYLASRNKSRRTRGLQIINTESMSVEKRSYVYSQGGVLSITRRILVVDLITELLAPEKLTGLVVLHAEQASPTSTEAFILRIYRQKNKEGFIKAFTDAPESLASGFAPLSKSLNTLFLRTPLLYPRFHVSVAESLENEKSTAIELEISLTEDMRYIQNGLIECIELCLSELKQSVPGLGLDVEDWNLDGAMRSEFDKSLRRQLGPLWHRLSWKTRGLLSDITTLRQLLTYVLAYDAVSFLKILNIIVATNSPSSSTLRQNQSPWLYLDAANTVFTCAKRRVYKHDDVTNLTPVLEEQPKWLALQSLLDEIAHDILIDDNVKGPTLVMCADERTCSTLRGYLTTCAKEVEVDESVKIKFNGSTFMLRKLHSYTKWRTAFGAMKHDLFKTSSTTQSLSSINSNTATEVLRRKPPHKRRRIRGGGCSSDRGRDFDSVTDSIDDLQMTILSEMDNNEPHRFQNPEAEDTYYELYDPNDTITVLPYSGDMDDIALQDIQPAYVIMYDVDAAFIRRVEVYKSSLIRHDLKIYFMYYKDSIEEQRYLNSVRREKEAFTRLIRERGSMALTLTDTVGADDPQDRYFRTINTRIAGGGQIRATAEPPRVVVDVREFRSSLPSLLHGRNITIVPCMLTIGDYVLTPSLVVERKSLKDLITSLNSGRLYSQCEMMMENYKTPLLLIEFEEHKSFSLEPMSETTGNISLNTLQSKLVMLTIAFPRLRIIWSSSPYATAEIFEDLKKNHEEPDPIKAVQLGLDNGEEEITLYNPAPERFLRSLPGLNSKNFKNIMLAIENIRSLANSTLNEMVSLIGPENGRQLYNFLNKGSAEEQKI